MPLHDAYARRTPFELAFPDREAADAFVRAVTEEAEARGVDPSDRAAFSMLGSVGAAVHGLQGPDAPGVAIRDYAALLFHAFHFVREGRPVHLVDVHVARYLVEGPAPGGTPEPPARAGYVQLPRHLFWVGGEGDEAAEPVDGFFWTLSTDGSIHVLLATGMREGRSGLAVVPLPDAPWAEAGAWMDAHVREVGADFATTLPGGELEGLYSFTAAGEVLKLAARLFAYEGAVPEAVEKHAPPTNGRDHGNPVGAESREPGGSEGPTPSSLPYRRIVLHG